MANITLIAGKENTWAGQLFAALATTAEPTVVCAQEDLSAFLSRADSPEAAKLVYVPSFSDGDGMAPDLSEAGQVFEQCARLRPARLILLSSALIYGTGTARQAFASEEYATPQH